MDIIKIIMAMREMGTINALDGVLTLKEYWLDGNQVYKLYHNCCQENESKFWGTILLFKHRVFTPEDVQINLNLPDPIPFIDDIQATKFIEGKILSTDDPKWGKWCERVQRIFLKNLRAHLLKVPSIDTGKPKIIKP